MVVLPLAGCLNALQDYIADRLATANYVYHLFRNAVSVGPATVIGDFLEATFPGYLPVLGSSLTWGAPAIVGNQAQVASSPISFRNLSAFPQVIYGVYVTDAGGTRLYFAESDPLGPVTIPINDEYLYTPTQQLASIT